jgi:transposase
MMGSCSSVAIEPASAATAKRRRRSIEERRRIVEETYQPKASVARVARAHGLNANQVFHWRRLYQRGLLGGQAAATATLVPVTVADAVPTVRLATTKQIASERSARAVAASAAAGIIHLDLPKGRLRIEGAADPASLRVVLESLLG